VEKKFFFKLAFVILLTSGTLGITSRLVHLTSLRRWILFGSITYLDWLFVSASVVILGYLYVNELRHNKVRK
jgi:hypothetical protein